MRHIGSKSQYPEDWEQIATRRKNDEGWKCERCNHRHDPTAGYTLTVHHLDGDKNNNADWNLAVLCQRCHLYMQAVIMDQMMFDFVQVSSWFKKHLEGYKRAKATGRVCDVRKK